MWRKLLETIQTTILGGAVLVGVTGILSKLFGLIRQRLIASTFGAEGADPIYAAFAIPDFIYGTLILGSLLTSFMPVFIAYRQRDQAEAWRISRSILNILMIVFFSLGLILLVAAEPLVKLLVGHKFGLAAQHTAIVLTRIMSMNMLLFSISNVFAGVLHSFRHFVAVSLAPIFNNLGIIAGLLWFVPVLGPAGVAWGAVGGAFLHTTIHAAAAWRVGWRPGRGAGWRHPGVRQIGQLLVPRTVGQSVTQLNQLATIPIATRLGPANLSIFRWANDIQDFPVTIMGLSMATVAFPRFVELLSQGRREEFVQQFSTIVRNILFVIIPVTVLFLQLRAQFVRVIIGAGQVSWPETIATAQTLGFFALSFFAQSLIPVLARSFYAMQDTKTPMRYTIAAVSIAILGSVVLSPIMGVQGLALAYSVSSVLNAGLLALTLHRRIGHLDDDRIIQSVIKILGVTILMALTVQATKYFLVSFGLDLTRAVGVLAQAVVAGAVGLISYAIFASLFRLSEASLLTSVWQQLRDRVWRNGLTRSS
ncbi:MAG: murein biosynthesis integral membrane protein MurJ [Candidatus Kerfeldbacteria bacterium]|nr:murein biosynthesis integral membrane protein MurJ [Candidatus Kerfeldbacteria bacterium]